MERVKKADRGDLIVEAMLVMVVVIFALLLVMGVGFIIYQQANVNIVANRAASRVAEIYPLVKQDLETAEIDAASVEDIPLYRYIIGDELKEDNTSKAMKYAGEVLKHSSLLPATSMSIPTPNVVHDGLGRRHVEVTVTATYQTPMLASMKFFGLSDTVTYTGVGRAQCVDTIDYINLIGYTKDMSNKLGDFSPIVGAARKIINTINHIVKTATNW